MICSKCGSTTSDDQKICPVCGLLEPSLDSINYIANQQQQNTNNQQGNINNFAIRNNRFHNILYFLMALLVPASISLFLGVRSAYQSNIAFQDNDYIQTENIEDNSEKKQIKFNKTSDPEDFEKQAEDILINTIKNDNEKCSSNEINNLEAEINKISGALISNFCEIDIDYLKTTKERIKKIYEKYPKLYAKLIAFNYEDSEQKKAYAYFKVEKLGKNSNFTSYYTAFVHNKLIYKNIEVVKKYYERDLETSFHPKNTTYLDIVIHELGHSIEFAVGLKRADIENILVIEDINKFKDFLDIWNNYEVSEDITKEAIKNVNTKRLEEGIAEKTEIDLINDISEYAASKDNKNRQLYPEVIAEAFAEYFVNQENSSELTLELMPILEREVSKL